MFGKLLKYEFKSQQKLLTILSFATLGAGLLGGLALWLLVDVLQDTEGVAAIVGSVLSTVFLIGVILGIVAYAVAVIILLLYRFYKHHFSEEGYLTFTLPVKTHQVLLASLTNFFLWDLIVLIVGFCAMCLIFAPSLAFAWAEAIPEMKLVWQELASLLPQLGGGYVAVSILSMVATWAYSLVIPLTCITIGCLLTKKFRILTSFAIYYGLQLGMSLVTGVISTILTVIGIAQGSESEGLLWLSSAIPGVLQLGLAIGGYFLMHRMISKKLNLP